MSNYLCMGFSSRCWATRQHLLQTLLLFRDGVWADAWERVWAFEGTDGSNMHRRHTPSAPIHRRPHPRDLSGHGKPHCQWLSSVVKKGHRGFFFRWPCQMQQIWSPQTLWSIVSSMLNGPQCYKWDTSYSEALNLLKILPLKTLTNYFQCEWSNPELN